MNRDITLTPDTKHPITQPRHCYVAVGSTLLLHMYKPVVIKDDLQQFHTTAVNTPRHRSPSSEKVRKYLLINSAGESYYTEDASVLSWVSTRKFEAVDILDYFESIEHTGFYFPECLYTGSLVNGLVDQCNAAVDPLKEALEPFVRSFPSRKVVAAANLVTHESLPNGSLIIAGARHYDSVMRPLYDVLELKRPLIGPDATVQGFIDQWGVWMDRKLALSVVKYSGQPFDAERNGSTDELYSEGVW